jgi:UDP-2,3-diacylglucosamine pyrophosphatase LpxH
MSSVSQAVCLNGDRPLKGSLARYQPLEANMVSGGSATAQDDLYQRQVKEALDRVLQASRGSALEVDLDTGRWIIFSDLHKGTRDNADDFQDCENAYHAALGYYLELGYQLIVLGDVEELWEENAAPVLEKYRSTLELEAEFHKQGRYWRFWGNHDDSWRFPELVKKHLDPLYPDVEVHEGLVLSCNHQGNKLGEILLVHGHQGTAASDRFGWLSRIFVRYVWRNVQRVFKMRINTPASDWDLRKLHNIALYNWAVKQEGLILIAGHTHHPVFDSSLRLKRLERGLSQARKKSDNSAQVAQLRAELEYAEVRESRAGFTMSQPCYFNTGCCCFDDGDITGLEIADGLIRLVRWPDNDGHPKFKLLAEADLVNDVFDSVAHIGEHELPDK